jgi:predicted nucleic acid-binding Zn ribbon protein
MDRKPGSEKGKLITRRNMRADIVSQWVGASRPLDLNKNVTEPSRHIESILEAIGVRGGMDEERVKDAWKSIAGGLIAQQTEPVSLRKGCLTLKVLQPAMRYHLEQLKPGLLRKLKDELGEDNVTSLRLTVI